MMSSEADNGWDYDSPGEDYNSDEHGEYDSDGNDER